MKGYLGRGQHGIAMVEFAIALPFLLLMLLAIGEFGRMFYQYNVLLQSVRDAGRYVAGKAWDNNVGKVVLEDEDRGRNLIAEAQRIAVYGRPESAGDADRCEADSSADGCQPLLNGLELGDVSVFERDDYPEYVEVRISYGFVPVVGNGIPALFGAGLDLRFELVASSVVRAL